MKIFSHVAMLLAFFAGNMAMWGQISRTVSFDLNSRHESNYCLGANTNEFTLTIDTKLESIDSLQAYDISIRYNPSKIRIVAALRTGTISNLIPQANFFFKNPEKGLTEVIGYTGLGKNSPNLIGEGALVALRGEWIDSKCPDTTNVKIAFFDPGFEFGIGPRYVQIDSNVALSNRVFDSIETKITMSGETNIEDTLSYDQVNKKYRFSRTLLFGKASGNDTVSLQYNVTDSLKVLSVSIDSTNNVIASKNGNVLNFTKIQRGIYGFAKVEYEVEIQTTDDTSNHSLNTFSKSTKCDCSSKMDSLQSDIELIRMKKPDTVISSVVESDDLKSQCTDFYDILGRFIESDCPNNELTKAITRRKAFKLGNNYIQYLDSK